MPLAKRLTRSLCIAVRVESDRNAAVLGECWHGAARGKSDAIVLMIGTGIGAGILSGGRIIRGAHALSGCAGWLTVTREDVDAARDHGEFGRPSHRVGCAATCAGRRGQQPGAIGFVESYCTRCCGCRSP